MVYYFEIKNAMCDKDCNYYPAFVEFDTDDFPELQGVLTADKKRFACKYFKNNIANCRGVSIDDVVEIEKDYYLECMNARLLEVCEELRSEIYDLRQDKDVISQALRVALNENEKLKKENER